MLTFSKAKTKVNKKSLFRFKKLLRSNMFWDIVPFITLIHIKERQRGVGKNVILLWESEMKAKGYNIVMTSTQVDENAQFFIEKLAIKIVDVWCSIFQNLNSLWRYFFNKLKACRIFIL